MVAGGGQHALDLVVFALFEHDFQLEFSALDADEGGQGGRFIVQLHAGQELRHQLIGHGLLRGSLVNLGNVTLR